MDCGEDGVPGFNEVVAAGVGEDAEGSVGGVGGEDVADELVSGDVRVGLRGRRVRSKTVSRSR